MAFKEIIDSKTDNVNCKDSIYKDCGVAGSDEARGSNFPSDKELRASQQRGGEGNGTSEGNYNDQEKDFGQNYAAPGNADNSDSPSEGAGSLPFLR